MSQPSIFLVGMMASGKTTIGRHLATLLGFAFEDSDAIVEARTGADISWIFDVEGEAGFRRRERAAIADATARKRIVLATGGGAVLSVENRSLLRQRGVVVHLDAAADVLVERLRRDRRRPLLQDEDPAKRVADLLAERGPLYRATAHLSVATDHRPARSIAAEVLTLLRQRDRGEDSGAR